MSLLATGLSGLPGQSAALLCSVQAVLLLFLLSSVLLLVLRALHYYAQVNHRRCLLPAPLLRDSGCRCGSLSNLVGFSASYLYPITIGEKGIITLCQLEMFVTSRRRRSKRHTKYICIFPISINRYRVNIAMPVCLFV